VLGVSHKANHFGLNGSVRMMKAHRNVSMNFLTIWRTGDIVIRTLKAISIDQLAEYKVRQSIERQRLCIHIILTLVVSYTSSVYNWSTSSSFQTISRVSVNDFQITDKIEIMRAAVISKPNIPHLGIVKVVVTNIRNIARYKIHIN
jgi:hypothetical protein